ncbi:GNAT family N-acetyltransferase [Salinarimonas ramus]|uniref:N-acetyltransferase n=1 Tax=Salinarimonas ramus TaxID=690164 RepID=A0A917V6B5_9HYPH|nr:GNAT family N-acetyltransferase [Salinarimonas ramus]GGK42981.1 N-acetyltransferase [Salinarimonas ramus]
MTEIMIRRLDAEAAREACAALADIHRACVARGASVSLMADTPREEALAFWRSVAADVGAGGTILLVAENDGRMVGTVQVCAAGRPNQPHRGDLAKMLVHPDAQGRGVGTALLAAAEREALAAGLWLLVLDTTPGTAAERLYTRGSWEPVGVIPDFALWPDGRLGATKLFYKDLRGG